MEGRLIGEVDLPRVTGFGAELATLLDRPRCDERNPLVSAPPAGDDLPPDVSLPRVTDPRGRPPVFSRDYPRGGGPAAAQGDRDPSLVDRPRRRSDGMPGGRRRTPVPVRHPEPHASGSASASPVLALPAATPVGLLPVEQPTWAYAGSLSRARPPESPSPASPSTESGVQTARTSQSAPSLHSTEDLLWIEDAMKEAWCRRRAAQAAASQSPDRARTGLGPWAAPILSHAAATAGHQIARCSAPCSPQLHRGQAP